MEKRSRYFQEFILSAPCLPPDLQSQEAVNKGGGVVAGGLCLSGVLLCAASGGQTGQAETV